MAQASYTPTAMDYDFALITLKDSGMAAGYMGMDYGNGGQVTLNLTTAGYPVGPPSHDANFSDVKCSVGHARCPSGVPASEHSALGMDAASIQLQQHASAAALELWACAI